jgi:hypothetical protein
MGWRARTGSAFSLASTALASQRLVRRRVSWYQFLAPSTSTLSRRHGQGLALTSGSGGGCVGGWGVVGGAVASSIVG